MKHNKNMQIKTHQQSCLLLGFTLVELLVVMTIVAILATISSIYILGNFESSRDSVRLTDISNIEKALNIYYTDGSNYPTPDDAIDVTYSGSMVWTQGEFGSGITREMKNFGSQIPSDPKYSIPYAYSIANNANEYQIAGIFEGDEDEEGLGELSSLIVPQARAAVERALVRGDYNNFLVQTSTGGIDTYIATPSIISAEIFPGIEVVDIITQRKLVYDDFFNLPANYNVILESVGGFNFNVSDPIVFEGPESELKTPEGLELFGSNLKYIYATTPTESFDIFRRILDSDNTNTILKDFLTKNFRVRFGTYFDCRDIYDSGEKTSGDYKIDPDGVGIKPEETVYCDMDTGGGGWTKKTIVDFSGGEFSGGSDISSKVDESGSTIVNLGASNTPVNSGYAMRQTTPESYYEIGLENQLDQLSDLEIGDNLRLSLWVRDDDDTSANSWASCSTAECLENPVAGYAFHNALYGNDGLNYVNGLAQTIDTVTTADGKVWKKQLLRTKITRSLDDFSWSIGRGFGGIKDIYITGVEIEVYYGGYEAFEQ